MSYNGSGNTIPLISMRHRTETNRKQLGSNAQNLVCVPVTLSYSEGVQKIPLKIGLINCQSVTDETIYAFGELAFDTIVLTETWLTGGISDQKIVGDMTAVSYSNHQAARTHGKDATKTINSLVLLEIVKLPKGINDTIIDFGLGYGYLVRPYWAEQNIQVIYVIYSIISVCT